MSKPKYHGWIYIQRTKGENDSIYASVRQDAVDEFLKENKIGVGQENWLRNTENKFMGYGAQGAQAAVDFFEKILKLGPVKLLETPLGLRVYTENEEREKKSATIAETRRKWLVNLLAGDVLSVQEATTIRLEENSTSAIRFHWKACSFRIAALQRDYADADEIPFLVEQSHDGMLVSSTHTEALKKIIKDNYKGD